MFVCVHPRPVLGLSFCMVLCAASSAWATAEFVNHEPASSVYGEPAGATMREPQAPREGDTTTIWARIGYAYYWTHAAVYYTTDGSEPRGAFGNTLSGSTSVMEMSLVRTDDSIDWVRATIRAEAQPYGTMLRYKISAWDSTGGLEVFANNNGCADEVCDNASAPQSVFSYAVKLPWPGRGFPHAVPEEGLPNVHFLKEEAVVGNNYMNVQLDQNGTLYDIYFPSVGCVRGMGTRNPGYVDGPDTSPTGLTAGLRGQMNVNQAQAGLRVDGVTYWLSNEGGAYDNHEQSYVSDTNVVHTSCRLAAAGDAILVDQYDFCPKGMAFPTDTGRNPVRGLYIKRYVLTNNSRESRTLDFYYHADFAINGGDGFDGMFTDPARGALVGFDNTQRLTSFNGEYNPTSFGDYLKNVAVYLGAAVKSCDSVGSAVGRPATDFWRDSSSDESAGWVGLRITLAPGQTREVDVAIVGGVRNTSDPSDTYANVVAPAIDWFHASSMSSVQVSTESYWTDWLASGVTTAFPDPAYDTLFKRGLLATALHIDANGGGIIAGMHNGAYPFVRPRDALQAAITLDRTGHITEAGEVFRFLRDVAYRASDAWGKGFWYQKYTTDGYQVWTAPQVDETANVPWAGYYHYLATGKLGFLNGYYTTFYEAARAMSEDSSIDKRLYYDDPNNLMHASNVWEDAFDDFLYSNAAVVRGLRDAARIASATNHPADAAMFAARADAIQAGLNGRLDWDGENTDISQVALVWPFETHTPIETRMAHVMDRINGVAHDRFGNTRPLVNDSGELKGLINRYWGDTYWNGGPWSLSTLWYGQFYARRQDYIAGKGDIDNFKSRIDNVKNFLGPVGLGAEQMAPGNSLLYPGEWDFRHQGAWPDAASMSSLVDSLMLFLDHTPDAANQRLKLAPKLPSGWNSMTYRNIRVGGRSVDVTCTESPTRSAHTFKNVRGGKLSYETYVRVPSVLVLTSVRQNGVPVAYTYEPGPARVHVTGLLNEGSGATSAIEVTYNDVRGDFNHDGRVNSLDFDHMHACEAQSTGGRPDLNCAEADLDDDGDIDMGDFDLFQRCYSGTALVNPACDD